jgi:hypothetical protein
MNTAAKQIAAATGESGLAQEVRSNASGRGWEECTQVTSF